MVTTNVANYHSGLVAGNCLADGLVGLFGSGGVPYFQTECLSDSAEVSAVGFAIALPVVAEGVVLAVCIDLQVGNGGGLICGTRTGGKK